ncbi:hypothetical protein O0L34_g8665 [Tuta absoluta]|nr:hypothetical protein O0L34_g8665 [Tuta absoluta]
MYQFVFVLALFGSQGILAKHHGRLAKSADDGKIVGGYNTTIQNIPYQVYLLLQKGNDYFQCGGSIINRYYILTAAHCLADIEKAYIRAGSTEANSGGTMYTSTDLRQHPLYNSGTSDYDAGLIRLSEPIQINNTNTKTVRLARSGSSVPAGQDVLVSGWGTTSENGNVSTNLMAAKIPVVSNTECNKDYNGGITSRMFCAGAPEGGKDSCQGDSGGPAVGDSDGIQKGIVSFGVGCARQGYPGVYARIANPTIRSWIRLNSGV